MAVIEAEKASSGAAGSMKILAEGGFEVVGTPYEDFISAYFHKTNV